jgi:two-component system chemotaxis response regulator CheB
MTPPAGNAGQTFAALPTWQTWWMNGRPRAVVAVGASAGGVEALQKLVASLPPGLPAAVAIVLHVTPTGTSRLPQILSRAGPLPAAHAADGEPACAGRIYVAPPDRHLLVRDGSWSVVRGPRENQMRPAIDPLFRSVAVAFGRNVVAVVLSGMRSDGSAGARAVTARGGTVIVQDPGDAGFPDMPANAIAADHPDGVLPVGEIGPAVTEIVRRLSEEGSVRENEQEEMSLETRYAALDRETVERAEPPGEPSRFSCPACGGVLWSTKQNGGVGYRCRVGHAYSADGLLDDQADTAERALWAAYRALQERADLCRRIADRQNGNRHGATAQRFRRLAREALEQAELIRTVLLEGDGEDG